jgi:hypothetical protein
LETQWQLRGSGNGMGIHRPCWRDTLGRIADEKAGQKDCNGRGLRPSFLLSVLVVMIHRRQMINPYLFFKFC